MERPDSKEESTEVKMHTLKWKVILGFDSDNVVAHTGWYGHQLLAVIERVDILPGRVVETNFHDKVRAEPEVDHIWRPDQVGPVEVWQTTWGDRVIGRFDDVEVARAECEKAIGAAISAKMIEKL